MSDPRWTIDEDGYVAFTWDEETWDILDVADGVKRGHEWALEGFDALVAAVRDAALLRQARETLRAAYDEWLKAVEDDRDDDTLERLFAQLIAEIHPLLLPSADRPPFLASPAPDSGMMQGIWPARPGEATTALEDVATSPAPDSGEETKRICDLCGSRLLRSEDWVVCSNDRCKRQWREPLPDTEVKP